MAPLSYLITVWVNGNLDRSEVTSRDIFDCWFFLQNHCAINADIVESRMGFSLADYIQKCIERLETISDKSLISWEN